ncbi:glycosyltransferase [Plesiomonas shigelloides]|nr:glycosyltransferase [Plesiomonas shigelloides]
MSSEIKVSVCVVTYNQEKYIAECLQSLVDQVTNFPFEIIVGEDCSTDKTREIVLEFQNKYPDIIKPLLHEQNVGASKNYLMTHAKACGKYIAHMDADDYALPGKLQAQADFLDKNPKCNMVFHRMDVIDGDNYMHTKMVTRGY